MAAPIRLAPDGKAVEAGSPQALFETHLARGGAVYRQQYAVAPDGRRFLMNLFTEESSTPITVALNWSSGLKK